MSRSASYARGHKETSETGKWDPGGYSLDTMRADTTARLAGSDDEDDIMGEVTITGISDQVAQAIAKAIWERYQPGGKNLATWFGEIGQDVEQIKNQTAAK